MTGLPLPPVVELMIATAHRRPAARMLGLHQLPLGLAFISRQAPDRYEEIRAM
jgi:hypothetical protein